MEGLSQVHREIIRVLVREKASYAHPIRSERLGMALHLAPSYVREQVRRLQDLHLVGARRGPGGGYFLLDEEGLGSAYLPPGHGTWDERAVVLAQGGR